ncbi:MAG: CoA transferase [Candidatus Rokubacteria bacterium]|nr:CoA transferase [Candidatus Rokubacteria bacterium]
MTRPLDGIRVLDLTRMIVGPTATMLLADMGADVVKVEPPAGDDVRYMQTTYDPEHCPFFLAVNRNKRGIVVDLTKPDGLAVFFRLAAGADVVIHNFRPGVVEKLGITYDDVRAVAPTVIYCSISAFGERGPYARRPGTDILFQAMGGLMSISGEPDGRPLRAGAPIIDVTTGVSVAFAILSALIRRGRTGEGDKIESSLYDQAVFMQSPVFSWFLKERRNPPRLGNRSPMALIMDLRTADGDLLVAIPSTKFWRTFCGVAGVPELAADARFRTTALRLAHQQALMDLVDARFRAQTTDAWVERLVAAGVPCGPVRSYEQVVADPQLAANGTFLELDHEVAGRTRVVNLPFRIGHVPVRIARTPPTLGRDTTDVLREAGYDDGEIKALEASGVTAPAPLAES